MIYLVDDELSTPSNRSVSWADPGMFVRERVGQVSGQAAVGLQGQNKWGLEWGLVWG